MDDQSLLTISKQLLASGIDPKVLNRILDEAGQRCEVTGSYYWPFSGSGDLTRRPNLEKISGAMRKRKTRQLAKAVAHAAGLKSAETKDQSCCSY